MSDINVEVDGKGSPDLYEVMEAEGQDSNAIKFPAARPGSNVRRILAIPGASKFDVTLMVDALNNLRRVGYGWDLDADSSKFLADMILADTHPTPVTLSLGYVRWEDHPDAKFGLRVHVTDYPEEGASLLVEDKPKGTPTPITMPANSSPWMIPHLLRAIRQAWIDNHEFMDLGDYLEREAGRIEAGNHLRGIKISKGLREYKDGQWWMDELEKAVKNGPPPQRQALSVIRGLLHHIKEAYNEGLCQDEGCPHHGTAHVCVSGKDADRGLLDSALKNVTQYSADRMQLELEAWKTMAATSTGALAEFSNVKAHQLANTLAELGKGLPSGNALTYQSRVTEWAKACFKEDYQSQSKPRGFRFTEEALEMAQALGVTREEVKQLVDYVYDRPVGDLTDEAGGTLLTLAHVCDIKGIDLMAAGEKQLSKAWNAIDRIRAKAASAPENSPLPGTYPKEEK